MTSTLTWERRFLAEINQAESARQRNNEGMARVCARRAAGIVVGEYFQRNGLTDPGTSGYDRLRRLAQLPSLPQETRHIAGHFILRIDTEHRLPVEADLVGEAWWLAQALLGYTQPRL